MTMSWIEWVGLIGGAWLLYYISLELFLFACVGGFAQVTWEMWRKLDTLRKTLEDLNLKVQDLGKQVELRDG